MSGVDAKRIAFALLVLAWACTDAPGPAAPTESTESLPPPSEAAAVQGRYIVSLPVQADAARVADEHGVLPTHVYQRLGGFAAPLTAGQLRALRARPGARVEPDAVVRTTDLPWGLDRVDQRDLPLDGGYAPPNDGAGVTAYVVDTGIDYGHEAFGGRASFGWDVDGSDGSDCDGHGTHVSGTIAGTGYGIATAARLVSVKVFPGCDTSTPVSTILAAIDWLMSQPQGVVNMSLGGGRSEVFNDAVATLQAAGYVVVVSAGNESGDACLTSPASSPPVITVGATDDDDGRAGYSNFGGCLDIFAPGSAIESAAIGGGSRLLSGTSMAAPHVSGAAALAWASGVTPSAVRDSLWSWATTDAVTDGRSINNHLLYVHAEHDPKEEPVFDGPVPTPGPFELFADDRLSAFWIGWTWQDYEGRGAMDVQIQRDARGDWLDLGRVYYSGSEQSWSFVTAQSHTTYGVRIRAVRLDGEVSDYTAPQYVETCHTKGKSRECRTKGGNGKRGR